MTTTEMHTDRPQESTDNHQQHRTAGVTPSAAVCVDETPTPDVWETPLRPTAPAARLGIGRFTVDLVDTRAGVVLAFVGRGVGSDTEAVALPISTAVVLAGVADTADGRTVWETAAWPFTSRPAGDMLTRESGEV